MTNIDPYALIGFSIPFVAVVVIFGLAVWGIVRKVKKWRSKR